MDSELEKMIEIIKQHAERYPLMQPQDAVKLLYQGEFGGGHLISSPSASLKRLEEEYALTPQTDAPLTESIGNGIVRVNLCALDANSVSVIKLNDVFVRSSAEVKGDLAQFKGKLSWLIEFQRSCGVFAFSADELAAYLSEYAHLGFPPVSHSDIYRKAYSPAYRVVSEELLKHLS